MATTPTSLPIIATVGACLGAWATQCTDFCRRRCVLMLCCMCTPWSHRMRQVSADGALQPQAVHPWDPHSCVGNFWTRWRRGFVRAMGMYLPVHLATRALVGWRRVRKDAWSALPLTWRALLGAVRSSSFLGMFIGESRNVHIEFRRCHARSPVCTLYHSHHLGHCLSVPVHAAE